VVLRPGIRGRDKPSLHRQAVHRALHEQSLPKAVDAIHALLSLVQNESAEAVEARRQPAQLPSLQMGHREGILELLCVVQVAGAAKVIVGGDSCRLSGSSH